MKLFLDAETALQLPFITTVVQIAVITLIPVSLGMVLHSNVPSFANRVEKYVKWLSLFFLGLIIVGLLVKERANVAGFFLQAGGVTLVLMIITMALGYAIATLAQLDNRSATAITVEVGIQNGTLAIAIASAPTFLNNPPMAIPAAIYAHGRNGRLIYWRFGHGWFSNGRLGDGRLGIGFPQRLNTKRVKRPPIGATVAGEIAKCSYTRASGKVTGEVTRLVKPISQINAVGKVAILS